MRITKQRIIILEELRKCVHHPGADEIFFLVRKHLPNISLGTVYRNLEFLAASGVIQKLEYGDGQKRFDGNPDPHHHFKCTKCGGIEDIPFEVDPVDLNHDHPWVKERIIKGSRLEFYGLCKHCSQGRHCEQKEKNH
jgi:Fur family transcriptional regulator, ferric uptake regulator